MLFRGDGGTFSVCMCVCARVFILQRECKCRKIKRLHGRCRVVFDKKNIRTYIHTARLNFLFSTPLFLPVSFWSAEPSVFKI